MLQKRSILNLPPKSWINFYCPKKDVTFRKLFVGVQVSQTTKDAEELSSRYGRDSVLDRFRWTNEGKGRRKDARKDGIDVRMNRLIAKTLYE